jgi:hypothetical protein
MNYNEFISAAMSYSIEFGVSFDDAVEILSIQENTNQ